MPAPLEYITPALMAYAEAHSDPEPPVLVRLRRLTHLRTLYPQMLSSPLQGRLLAWFSALVCPSAILEIGTFTGYSCICLAEGLAPGGHIITLELTPERDPLIRMAFEEAGISDRVQVHYGDARQTLPTLSGPFDLVFIDADKRAYPVYYELVLPLVRPGGVILADNVLWSGTIVEPEVRSKEAENLRLFNDRVRQDERVSCVLLPFRDGITFIRKR